MDLTYDRFHCDVIPIIYEISRSHFVAFDLEFSGVAGRGNRQQPGKPSLQELYEETKAAADKYQVLQVGLTIVQEDAQNGQYIAKPYNFNISPLPRLKERHFRRDWCMNSGAVQFLLKNRFNFGQPLIGGIPYLSRLEEKQARLTLMEEDQVKRADMITNKAEDEALIKHIRKSMTDWQKQPKDDREPYLNVPNEDRGKSVPGVLNRYQMRLTHQIVQNEFPGFKTLGMQNFVQITNPSPEEMERSKLLQKQRIDTEVGRAVGFRWILEALAGRDITGLPDEYLLTPLPDREMESLQTYLANLNERLKSRRRVLVGHNCFTDLVNLHKFFLGDLPASVEDFQDSIHELFPAVIDTKYIASLGSRRWGDTSLQAVADEVDDGREPEISIPGDFNRYMNNDSDHEAGFDSLLTAKIAIKLSATMERTQEYVEKVDKQKTTSTPKDGPYAFGIRDDGYVTAPENVDQLVISHDDVGTETPSTPAAVARDSHSLDHQQVASKAESPSQTPESGIALSTTSDPNEVLVVKDKKSRSAHWSPVTEVEKVRSTFAAVNMYELLDGNTQGDGMEQGEDLMSFSDPCSPAGVETQAKEQAKPVNIEEMVKNGQLMPRWDGDTGFWQIFGNKLQVNGCKEGVCLL